MTESTISAKGEVTIPLEIRKRIGGAPGTKLIWSVLDDGQLLVYVKNKSALDLKGMFAVPLGKQVSVEDMNPVR